MDYGTTTRDRLEAAERQIHAARAAREQELRNEDRAQRERLEKQSPSGARRGLVDLLNGQSDQRAARELPGVLMLEGIRRMQEVSRRTPAQHNESYARYELRKLAESFDRLSRSAMPIQGGAAYNEARLVDSRAKPRSNNFDFRGDEPGMSGGSNFGAWDRFSPPQRGENGSGFVVSDSAGSMDADARTRRDHWGGQGEHAVDLDWMLDAARSLIEAVRSKRYARGRV